MKAPEFSSIAPEYREQFRACTPRKGLVTSTAAEIVRRILDKQGIYESVALKFANQLPWWAIALVHSMESGLSFSKHLHNGDSLKGRTVQVPAGRPVTGQPPFTWAESALDALRYDGWHKVAAERWKCVEGVLYQLEAYNGWGYRPRRIPTPYLWAGSNVERPGKFTSDGKFDAHAVSKQIGAAVLLKILVEKKAASLPV